MGKDLKKVSMPSQIRELEEIAYVSLRFLQKNHHDNS